ncbi:MAG: portal protein [bacterium]
MAENNQQTIWQKLTKVLTFDPNQLAKNVEQSPIIKANSIEELKMKKLEQEQQNLLAQQWSKSEDKLEYKRLQWEAARLPAYIDYEGMEYYPLIGSSLDIFMEEATTIGDDGKMLHIYSPSERIKNILDDFFYNKIDILVNLPQWTRNLPIRHDSIIPLLDGTEKTIKEISEELKNNPKKEIWTYSVQNKTKNILPGKIVWCNLTRKNTQLVRVNLDNKTFIETTPDHEFMLRSGIFKQAKDLKKDDSLMPFYTKESQPKKDKIVGYEKVYNPSSNHYKYTHSLMGHEMIRDLDYENTINEIFDTDHVDFNKKNNNTNYIKPEKVLNHKVVSIEWLKDTDDVYCMEVVGPNNEQDRHNFPICSKKENGDYNRDGIFVSNCKYGDNFVHLLPKKGEGIVAVRQMINFDINRYDEKVNGKNVVKFKDRENNEEYNTIQVAHFRLLGDDKFLPYGASLLHKIRRTFRQLILAEDAMLTYRLLRAGEKRVFKIDVGNMDTSDIEAYIQRVATRFKKSPEINRQQGTIDYRFNVLGVDEDFFIPTRGGQGSVVEQLDGGSNLDKINDIGYLRDNLFTGLGIPKPFLGYQDATGEGKNLSMMDVRFAKKVNRIQQALIQELNKMAMIHLYLLGFEDDMNNFTLRLTNPSIQSDLLKIEAWQSKVGLYQDMTDARNGIAPLSHTEAKRLVFNMSDAEIIEDLKMQRMEQALINELKETPSIIPKTGFFNDIDRKYGQIGDKKEEKPKEDGDQEPEFNLGPEGGDQEPELPEESYKNRKYDKSLKLINEIYYHLSEKSKKNDDEIIDIDFVIENEEKLKRAKKFLE